MNKIYSSIKILKGHVDIENITVYSIYFLVWFISRYTSKKVGKLQVSDINPYLRCNCWPLTTWKSVLSPRILKNCFLLNMSIEKVIINLWSSHHQAKASITSVFRLVVAFWRAHNIIPLICPVQKHTKHTNWTKIIHCEGVYWVDWDINFIHKISTLFNIDIQQSGKVS